MKRNKDEIIYMSLLGFIGELQEAPAKESPVVSPPIFWPKHLPDIAPYCILDEVQKKALFSFLMSLLWIEQHFITIYYKQEHKETLRDTENSRL